MVEMGPMPHAWHDIGKAKGSTRATHILARQPLARVRLVCLAMKPSQPSAVSEALLHALVHREHYASPKRHGFRPPKVSSSTGHKHQRLRYIYRPVHPTPWGSPTDPKRRMPRQE